MYIVHDVLTDQYRPYKYLTTLAAKEKLSKNTLANKFTREKAERYMTRDARIIVKCDLI